MALDEQEEVREHLEEAAEVSGQYLDDRKQQVRSDYQCTKGHSDASSPPAILESLLSSAI
jgi:hypothetical protein